MSGRGDRNNDRGGRGHGGRGGCGRGRGQNNTGSANSTKKGFCANLGTYVFDYGNKSAADQMRTSWEKRVQYVGTNYGQDISNELHNPTPITLVEPVYTGDVVMRHGVREQMFWARQLNIQLSIKAQHTILQAAVTSGLDVDAPMKLAILQNEIAQGEFTANIDIPVELTDSEKNQIRS
jgi:hypothetical protein